MVMEVVHEDMGEGSMQCTSHPYKNSSPGGICAFCLQEKLGKLVSSFPVAVFPSSSSSSSPSFRSEFGSNSTTSTASAAAANLQLRHLGSSSFQNRGADCNYNGYCSRRSRLPFVLTHRKKKKKNEMAAGSSDSSAIVFKRCKSTTIPGRGIHFLDENYSEDYSPHRRGFWSFLYLSKHSSPKRNDNKIGKNLDLTSATPSTVSSTVGSSSMNGLIIGNGAIRTKKMEEFVVVEENGSPDQTACDRKVSRSRSVGCGSRSFSGDFFERISTGFGDCTLRRVESQREAKPKRQSIHSNGQDCIKERVRCGGIFSGFMITSYSSSSSSSSNWFSSSSEEKPISAAHSNLSHGRSRSWGWAFASPMRAFNKPSSAGKKVAVSNKNHTPNLSAIPSLLAASG